MKINEDLQKKIEDLQKEVERLKKELKKKKYGLVWEDKPEEVVEMCKKKLPVLKEAKDKEIITDKNKPVNLLIEGDNYHALSVLNYTHAGKVDVIYIDPPYNTGNKDFIFNDHFVDKEDAYRHSKWLSFMEKRLKLAKNLLKDTGVIFISIDDNEVAQLKLLMDNPDLFGENNFVANIIIQSNPRGKQQMKVAVSHEYLLVYARKIEKLTFKYQELTEEQAKQYNKIDSNGLRYREIGLRKRGAAARRIDVPNLFYPIYVNPKNGEVSLVKDDKFSEEAIPLLSNGDEGRWRWSKNKFEKEKDKLIGRLVNNHRWDIFEKDYLDEEKTMKPKSVWLDKELNYEKAKEILKKIFNGTSPFDYPKTIYLIKKVLQLSCSKNGLILDFMAGTGTTGQAVLELNKEDGGNLQFILCTNNENNICTDVCYPRIKKVIEGYKNLKGEQVEGLGGNLKYFKTDFVDYDKPTDKNKIKLTRQTTEMLCIKEETFELVQDKGYFKIFKNNSHYTGIIFDQLAIPEFKKTIENIDGTFSVYIFSLSDETFDEEFADVKKKVKLSPIPEAILRVYRRIFR
jgi:adenine-specific DNA-methyltransferase